MKSMGLRTQFVRGLAACWEAGKVTAILAGEILEGFLAKGCQYGSILWPLLWSLDVDVLIRGLNEYGCCTLGCG
jgi:hypothetical protein